MSLEDRCLAAISRAMLWGKERRSRTRQPRGTATIRPFALVGNFLTTWSWLPKSSKCCASFRQTAGSSCSCNASRHSFETRFACTKGSSIGNCERRVTTSKETNSAVAGLHFVVPSDAIRKGASVMVAQLFTAWNAIANLADLAGRVDVTIRAESEKGFDKAKLHNGVLEPLREADLIE